MFYRTSDTSPTITIDGVTGLRMGPIYHSMPNVCFITKGANFWIGGNNDGIEFDRAIIFDILIIRNSDSKGWLTEGKTQSYVYNAAARTDPYTLSSLTGGSITDAAGLDGYSVYVIVRSAIATGIANFNTNSFLKDKNVIKVTAY
jgi:hypothetical protein